MERLSKDVQRFGCITLGWEAEELSEDQRVTGSVVEFAFLPLPNSYMATSYPYRPHFAPKKDVRSLATHNVPTSVFRKIRTLRPRYIMHVAFRREPYTWVIYCYRGSRYAYDTKWQPKKPNANSTGDGNLGRISDRWKEDEEDQISYCSFGAQSDQWFMRSTTATTEWISRLGDGVAQGLWKAHHDYVLHSKTRSRKGEDLGPEEKLKDIQVSTVRATTFGPADAWILYSKSNYCWSDEGLPAPLVRALRMGKRSTPPWVINKAVLNPFDHREYVLVYDHGWVFCSFHSAFLKDFKVIIDEWYRSMVDCGRWTSLPNMHVEYLDPNDVAGMTDNDSDDDDGGGASLASAQTGSSGGAYFTRSTSRTSDHAPQAIPDASLAGDGFHQRAPFPVMTKPQRTLSLGVEQMPGRTSGTQRLSRHRQSAASDEPLPQRPHTSAADMHWDDRQPHKAAPHKVMGASHLFNRMQRQDSDVRVLGQPGDTKSSVEGRRPRHVHQ